MSPLSLGVKHIRIYKIHRLCSCQRKEVDPYRYFRGVIGYWSEIIYTVAANSTNGEQALQCNTLTTRNGEQFQVILPDGSHVWLDAASSLKYPAVDTHAGSILYKGVDGGWNQTGVYQEVHLYGHRQYKVDMHVQGSGANKVWFEVWLSKKKPQDGQHVTTGWDPAAVMLLGLIFYQQILVQ